MLEIKKNTEKMRENGKVENYNGCLCCCHNTLLSSRTEALKVREPKQSRAETQVYFHNVPAYIHTRIQTSTQKVIFDGWQRSLLQLPSPPPPATPSTSLPSLCVDLSVSHFHLPSIKFELCRMHTRRKQFVGAKPKLTL